MKYGTKFNYNIMENTHIAMVVCISKVLKSILYFFLLDLFAGTSLSCPIVLISSLVLKLLEESVCV